MNTLCGKVSAPANYLRSIPTKLAAECLNHSMKQIDEKEIGLRLRQYSSDGQIQRVANSLNGPKYGRVWNDEITGLMLNRGIDGVNGDWRIPGEFGRDVTITKDNTTLYSSDHDMFIFLADEKNRIELPHRRGGKSGTLARGFFIKNSEVGASRLIITTFLFDYACSNRIVWGAEQVMEVSIRHTSKAPESWLDRTMPALEAYHSASVQPIEDGLRAAQRLVLEAPKIIDMVGNVVGKRSVPLVQAAYLEDEGRPMETLWDVVTGITAYSRTIAYTDERMVLDKAAGDLLESVAPRASLLALPAPSKTTKGYTGPTIDF